MRTLGGVQRTGQRFDEDGFVGGDGFRDFVDCAYDFGAG